MSDVVTHITEVRKVQPEVEAKEAEKPEPRAKPKKAKAKKPAKVKAAKKAAPAKPKGKVFHLQKEPEKIGANGWQKQFKFKGKFTDTAKDHGGKCIIKGCTKNAKFRYCGSSSPQRGHAGEVRKAQLAANNPKWRNRVKAKTAGHHVAYARHASEFALEKKDAALRAAQSGASIYDPDTLKKMLAKGKVAAKKAAKKKAA